MKITVPENTEPINVVTKEIFDTIQVFVIPKPEMNRTTLTLTTGRLEFCEYRFNKKTVRDITCVIAYVLNEFLTANRSNTTKKKLS